jgi:hypothetical protein
MLKLGFPLVRVARAVADTTHPDLVVCTTEAGMTHCEAPASPLHPHRDPRRQTDLFRGQQGRRWMMIEEDGLTTIMPIDMNKGDAGGPKQ